METATAEVIPMDQLIIKEFDIEEITATNLALMKKQILTIPEKPETPKQYNSVKDMHIQAKKILPRIEERRKELKAPVLEKGKAIDDTAKKAVSMVQPLIDLAGTRRSAWEEEKAKEKAEKERIEKERLAKIDEHIERLSGFANKYQEYGRSAESLARDLGHLEGFEISAVDFQERTEEAEKIKVDAITATKQAFENRKKFEEEQAEAARIKAEQEAEAKRLAEEKAKLEADKKAQEEEARKKAEAEAEKRRKEEKKLQAERDALEKEKAEIAAQKKAEEDRKAALDMFNLDHAEALKENEEFDRRLKEKLKADAARAKVAKRDKGVLNRLLSEINEFIIDLDSPACETSEADEIVSDLFVGLENILDQANDRVSELA